jgi:GUN4-like/ARM-like repeat domain, GUN4-N terminal
MHDVQPTLNTPSELSQSESPNFIDELLTRLKSESVRNPLQLVQEFAQSGESGLEALMSFLLERKSQPVGVLEGTTYQILVKANTPKTQEFLQTHFPQGVVPLKSSKGIDYAPLQTLLAQQDFQTADRVTLEKMCELAGAASQKWFYFTAVQSFPITDLQTINTLWFVHSEGKFGFSVQRELWLALGKDWEKLWTQINWKDGNNWTRYPQGFTWDLSAPRGHLPLSNQLRGVRVMAALLAHPAWNGDGDRAE